MINKQLNLLNNKKEAWIEYQKPIKDEWNELKAIFNSISAQVNISEIPKWIDDLNQSATFGIFRRDFLSKARNLLSMIVHEDIPEKNKLRNFINRINNENYQRYNTKLYNETETSALKVSEVKPSYDQIQN